MLGAKKKIHNTCKGKLNNWSMDQKVYFPFLQPVLRNEEITFTYKIWSNKKRCKIVRSRKAAFSIFNLHFLNNSYAKEGIFVGPDIKKLMDDANFMQFLTDNEAAA